MNAIDKYNTSGDENELLEEIVGLVKGPATVPASAPQPEGSGTPLAGIDLVLLMIPRLGKLKSVCDYSDIDR